MPDSLTIRRAYIRYLLVARGKTQRDVAREADTTPATVARVIRGDRSMSDRGGEKGDAVWRALSKLTRRPIYELKDPPALTE